MTHNADVEIWDKTIEDGDMTNPIVERDIVWIPDSNSGSYNGQIIFDTSLLSNTGKHLSYSEAYLEIPFVMSAKSVVDVSGVALNAYMLGVKGYQHLIDSISVEYGTKNVVQLQSYLNFHTTFKLMTSFSQDDLTKHGASIGFIPDSAGSYVFDNVGTSFKGDGYSNNSEVGVNDYIRPETINSGFFERRRKTTAFLGSGYGLPTMNSVTKAQNVAKNYATKTGAGADQLSVWYVMACIRLKDLSDFFTQLPLIRNGFMQITVNYNSSTTVLTRLVDVAGPPAIVASLFVKSHTQTSGHSCPIMTGTGVGGGSMANYLSTVANEITISCGVGTDGNSAPKSGHKLTSCRLYCPVYKLDPLRERALMAAKPITTVNYNDIYSYAFNVGAAESFNQILSNGIVNAQYIVIMPFVRGTSGGTFARTDIPVYQSVFDSSPNTTSSASITDLQVSLAGENVLTQNARYDFEIFQNELSQINALLGGVTTGNTSGLVGRYEFDNAYRYYVVNLSRRVSAEDLVPKSVSVFGTNNSGVPLELVCFIGYKRTLKINTATGEAI